MGQEGVDAEGVLKNIEKEWKSRMPGKVRNKGLQGDCGQFRGRY